MNWRRHVTSTIFHIVFTATITHCTTCYSNNENCCFFFKKEKEREERIKNNKITYVSRLTEWIIIIIIKQ